MAPPFPSVARLASGWLRGRVPPLRRDERDTSLGTAYCAEIVAVTYQAMGLLPGGRRPDWYDAGRFWSGDDLRLCGESGSAGRSSCTSLRRSSRHLVTDIGRRPPADRQP